MDLKRAFNRQSLSWAIYDWANAGYALTILAGIFPIFYANYWAAGAGEAAQAWAYPLTVSAASLLVAAAAPFLGSLASAGGGRKRLMLLFVSIGVAATAALAAVGMGLWWLASCIYLVGTGSFYLGNLFYDSLITEVSHKDDRHFLSGFGYALGYVGSALVLIVSSQVIDRWEPLGFETQAGATRAVFVAAAILTPPDPFTQLALGIPILLLYEISVFLVRAVEKKRGRI